MLSFKQLPPLASRPGPRPGEKARSAGPAVKEPPSPPRPHFGQIASVAEPSPADPDLTHPFRKLALYFGIAAVFVRFAVLPEIIFYATGFNTYLLYLTAVPALIGCVLSGGIRRIFRGKAPYFLMACMGWMVLAIPFSSWRSDSLSLVVSYGRTNLVYLLIAGGAVMTWKEMKALFVAIAAAAGLNLLTAQLFMNDAQGRVSLSASGTIGNSNDLAAHLLLVLPFALFLVIQSRLLLILRIAVFGGLAFGAYTILRTASRGALIALLVGILFVIWRATPIQRVLAVAGGAALAVIFMALLPSSTASRLGSLFGEQHEEAQESSESRGYLFRTSVAYSFQHPLFGVGPGQFANFEGNQRVKQGMVGNWHETHCTFTQLSAECGIPALFFFLAATGSAIAVVIGAHRRAKRLGNIEVKNACFCFLVAVVCYGTAATFLSHAYSFYWPTLISIAIALSTLGHRKLDQDAARLSDSSRVRQFA